MDLNNVVFFFPYGYLIKAIYIEQFLGSVAQDETNKCNLCKAMSKNKKLMYDWINSTRFLLALDYKLVLLIIVSLFNALCIMIHVVYINEILLIGINTLDITKMKYYLYKLSIIKDVGDKIFYWYWVLQIIK